MLQAIIAVVALAAIVVFIVCRIEKGNSESAGTSYQKCGDTVVYTSKDHIEVRSKIAGKDVRIVVDGDRVVVNGRHILL